MVSLALISDDGTHKFYAEIDPLPDAPTDFVRSAVYPLLNRGSRAMQRAKFTTLRGFLAAVSDPSVLKLLQAAWA